MNSKLLKRGLLVAGLLLVLAACSSGPRVTANSDPTVDWGKYRTFGFFQPLTTDRGSVRSLTSTQLIASATREMEARGLQRVESNPDLLINFMLSTRETLQTRPSTSASASWGRGRYSTWGGYSMSMSTNQVVQRTEGSLAIDVVDRARNQLVWEAVATKTVTNSTRDNQQQVLDSAVHDMFERFPIMGPPSM